MENKNIFPLKPMCLYILLSIPISAYSDPIKSPYPVSPYHLQGQNMVITGGGAKPNVVVLYDNSGSMGVQAPGYPYYVKVLYESPYPYIRNKQFRVQVKDEWRLEKKYAWKYYEDGIKYFNAAEAKKPASQRRERKMETELRKKTRHEAVTTGIQLVALKYADRAQWAIWPLNPMTRKRKTERNTPGFVLWPKDYYDNKVPWQGFLALRDIQLTGGTHINVEYANDVLPYIRENMAFRCQKNHVIVITDAEEGGGVPTHSSALQEVMGSLYVTRTQGKYKFAEAFSDSISNRDIIPYRDMYNTQTGKVSLRLDQAYQVFDGKQTIETHTIGIGEEMRKGPIKYLNALASSPKNVHLVLDSESASFEKIFERIVSGFQESKQSAYFNTSGSTPGIIMDLGDTQKINGAIISTSTDNKSWSSEIRLSNANSTATIDQKKSQIPNYQSRKLLVSYLDPAGMMQYKFSTDADLSLNNEFFGIKDTANNSDEWKDALLPWFARSKSDLDIKKIGKSQSYRQRTGDKQRNVGDIIDSPMVNLPSKPSGNNYLVTAANDGLLYVFKHNKDDEVTTNYELALNYLPLSMQRESHSTEDTIAHTLPVVANANYGKNTENEKHRMLFNGGISLRETASAFDKNRRQTILAASLGQGGRGSLAINVAGTSLADGSAVGVEASTNNWKKSIPLLETPKGADNKLGYTINTPQIARLSLSKASFMNKPDRHQDVYYTMALASGFDYKDNFKDGTKPINNAALYIYDLLGTDISLNGTDMKNTSESIAERQGKLIRKIEVPDAIGGLASPIYVDTDLDDIADVAYAGDYGGSLYRFDLRGGNPDLWSVTKIFQGTTSKPITTAPVVMRQGPTAQDNGKLIVMFGTGSDLYESDFVNKSIQSFYGIYDNVDQTISKEIEGTGGEDASQIASDNDDERPKAVYALNDYSTELLKQTYGKSDSKNSRILSNLPFDKKIHRGWRVDLDQQAGERITAQPILHYNTVIFSTKTYDIIKQQAQKDPCEPTVSGTMNTSPGWVMSLNATNGGALTKKSARVLFDGSSNIINGKFFPHFMKLNVFFSSAPDLQYKARSQEGMYYNVGSDGDILLDTTKAHNDYKIHGTGYDYLIMQPSIGETQSVALAPPERESKSYSLKRLSWKELFD